MERSQQRDSSASHVCFIGAGYVGGTTAAVLALKNPSVQFTVVDIDPERIDAWNSRNIPIKEPGLPELLCIVSKTQLVTQNVCNSFTSRDNSLFFKSRETNSDMTRTSNLTFSKDVRAAIITADIIFITVNTPSKTTAPGWDLSYVESALDSIAEVSTTSKIVVQKSTVPCGTAERTSELLESKARPGVSFSVLSNPEFLAQGSALRNLLKPYSLLIGTNTPSDASTASLLSLYKSWVPTDKTLIMSTSSAELSKIACNALFAQRISSINSLSALCERVGADATDLSRVFGLNPRIGREGLQAGTAFGGSCLKKDTLGLVQLANDLSLPDVAEYWRQVIVMNDHQTSRFVKKVCRLALLSGMKKVAVFGYAYKRDTGDARDSMARSVILALLKEGIAIALHDSLVPQQNIIDDLRKGNNGLRLSVQFINTPYEACKGVDIVIIMNDSQEYQDLRWEEVNSHMAQGKIIFDGRGVLDATKLEALGFIVEKMGKSS